MLVTGVGGIRGQIKGQGFLPLVNSESNGEDR